MEQTHELKVVSIRLVDEPPLFSSSQLTSPKEVFELMGRELQTYDRELFCVLNPVSYTHLTLPTILRV